MSLLEGKKPDGNQQQNNAACPVGYFDQKRQRRMLLSTTLQLTSGPPPMRLNASLVHPREVFKAAILANADAAVISHTHPSGDTTPSAEDIRITKTLKQAGEIIDISVLDHVIVTTNAHFSLRDQGIF